MYRKIWIIIILIILLTSGSIAAEKIESFTWNKKELVIITATANRVEGFDEFVEEVRKVLLNVGNWQSMFLSDITKDKSHLELMKNNHTIFTIRPENMEEFEILQAKHDELMPIACSELESYSFPLLYLSRDDKGKIRGVIIADEVTPLLAKLLVKEGLPLNTPFWYENGQLKEIEKE